MNAHSLSPQAKGAFFVLGGAICISFAPLFVRMEDVGPTAVAFHRLLWGGLALLGIALVRRDRLMPSRSLFLLMILAAAFFAADLACWHQSILYIGPGLATIVTNFQVFFLALIGVIFLKERPGPRLLLSIPLAFIGLWMLLEVDLAQMPPEVAAGLFLGLCTAAFYTGYILSLRRSQSLTERLPAVANMAVISLLAMLFSGILSLAQGQSLAVPSLKSNLLLILYGIGCQALGWFLLSKGLPRLPASRAGLLMLIQPTLSFIWDVLFCGRPTGLMGYAGAALALLAISMGVLDSPAPKPTNASTPPPGSKSAPLRNPHQEKD